MWAMESVRATCGEIGAVVDGGESRVIETFISPKAVVAAFLLSVGSGFSMRGMDVSLLSASNMASPYNRLRI